VATSAKRGGALSLLDYQAIVLDVNACESTVISDTLQTSQLIQSESD
jgi:hypothetical protein